MISFSTKILREVLIGLRVLKIAKQRMAPLQCVLIHGNAETVVFEGTTLDEHLRYEGKGEAAVPAVQLVPYEVLNDALKSADPDSTIIVNTGAAPTLTCLASGSVLTVPFEYLKAED